MSTPVDHGCDKIFESREIELALVQCNITKKVISVSL